MDQVVMMVFTVARLVLPVIVFFTQVYGNS